MDHVVAAVRLELADPVDLGHHAVQQFGQLLLGQLPRRPGQDVVDAHARGGMLDGGLPGGRGPGEDLHLDAGLREGRGQRPDIHVHAPGVAGTGLLHGRGVKGQEGDTADQRHPSPLLPGSALNEKAPERGFDKTLLLNCGFTFTGRQRGC